MPFQTYELDAVKLAAAQAVADTATTLGIPEQDGRHIAMAVMEAIDQATDDPTDPRPFAPGRKVRVKGTGIPGVVQRTVDNDGEVHTVWVRLALEESPAAVPMSPRELEVID
jgi:hypothetical protein